MRVIDIPIIKASPNDKTPLQDVIEQDQARIIGQLNQSGALLFRGFACIEATIFSDAITQCGLGERCSAKDYDLPRTLLPGNLYTSSDLPGHIPLPLHHEKPRSEHPPHHLYFCCISSPKTGGGTILANAALIWKDMPKPIQDKILEHGVQYKQFFHGDSRLRKGIKKILGSHSTHHWPQQFETNEKALVEKKLSKENARLQWVNNHKDLIVTTHLPGALNHPITDQTVWFNSAAYLNYYSHIIDDDLKTVSLLKSIARRYLIHTDTFPLICHYGNGLAFSSAEIADIHCVIQQHTYVHNWYKGDFMIVDNFTFMHGKQAHQGDRLLYSCMTMKKVRHLR